MILELADAIVSTVSLFEFANPRCNFELAKWNVPAIADPQFPEESHEAEFWDGPWVYPQQFISWEIMNQCEMAIAMNANIEIENWKVRKKAISRFDTFAVITILRMTIVSHSLEDDEGLCGQ